MVVVFDPIGINCIASIDFIRCKGVLNVTPGEIVVSAVRGKQCPTRSPGVVGYVFGMNDDNTLPVAITLLIGARNLHRKESY